MHPYIRLTLAAGIGLWVAAFASPFAMASGFSSGGISIHFGSRHRDHAAYRNGYDYRYSHGKRRYKQPAYKRKHRYRHNTFGAYSSRRPHYARHGNCQQVSKVGDWDGYKSQIGGTLCRDEYGEAYIVPGSRYLIERY